MVSLPSLLEPPSVGWLTNIDWAGPELTAGCLEIHNEDRSAVASATIWIARAWYWLTDAVATSAERG